MSDEKPAPLTVKDFQFRAPLDNETHILLSMMLMNQVRLLIYMGILYEKEKESSVSQHIIDAMIQTLQSVLTSTSYAVIIKHLKNQCEKLISVETVLN
jgi:hypothetical protein